MQLFQEEDLGCWQNPHHWEKCIVGVSTESTKLVFPIDTNFEWENVKCTTFTIQLFHHILHYPLPGGLNFDDPQLIEQTIPMMFEYGVDIRMEGWFVYATIKLPQVYTDVFILWQACHFRMKCLWRHFQIDWNCTNIGTYCTRVVRSVDLKK